ncbi:uncharacterized protein Nmag_2100 [Natrialba magadii ATCC 43099]|uniref:Uncharacterized protein n=1 Tax=Natrialba magadii (strain ATCC 43099 / DSM 3394 / CCM 3739 / CIP 104546 / IAM 13178 / JCM 8861 / NBRC 102185 / NCIMB 2190 / MS3) TaxID=547559 RepID=D3SW08_NATMM|nr:uncharacterized protein Nmag_2100 [Natrialba magadii ATCC 43099]ELY29919.1 hypothetical protein C500_09924 [Natrialba magadii ATCC 43099]
MIAETVVGTDDLIHQQHVGGVVYVSLDALRKALDTR